MTTNTIQAYAALAAGEALQPYEFDAGTLADDHVEVDVQYCGLCHSDVSIIDNEWGISQYPVVPGHEIVGTITAMGSAVKGLTIGQRVGIGWTAASCQHCDVCIGGKANLCHSATPTIVTHAGGFANKVRAQWQWVIPLPDDLDMATAGPLLCGGITVFAPLLQHQINASHKVGVIGIGGLGHLAIDFFNAWGCEVTAFSSNTNKYDEIYKMGAHHIINSTDEAALKTEAASFDFIISTVNVGLNWNTYLSLLKPQGKLHFVGAVLKPLDIAAFSLISGAKSVTGSPTGSPIELRTMLNFAARMGVAPIVEEFAMSKVNQAISHLRNGKARYRVVLKADFE